MRQALLAWPPRRPRGRLRMPGPSTATGFSVKTFLPAATAAFEVLRPEAGRRGQDDVVRRRWRSPSGRRRGRRSSAPRGTSTSAPARAPSRLRPGSRRCRSWKASPMATSCTPAARLEGVLRRRRVPRPPQPIEADRGSRRCPRPRPRAARARPACRPRRPRSRLEEVAAGGAGVVFGSCAHGFVRSDASDRSWPSPSSGALPRDLASAGPASCFCSSHRRAPPGSPRGWRR